MLQKEAKTTRISMTGGDFFGHTLALNYTDGAIALINGKPHSNSQMDKLKTTLMCGVHAIFVSMLLKYRRNWHEVFVTVF